MKHVRTTSEFGEKLHYLMQRHQVRQVTLARLCGLTKSAAVYGWLKTGRINKQNLATVANYFGFTGDALYKLSLDEVLRKDAAMVADLKARQALHDSPTLEAALVAPVSDPLSGFHPLAVDAAQMMQQLIADDPTLFLIHEVHSRLWAMIQELTQQ